ncbi:unnamed protein product [Rotaria magnacalcarata]|uniref:Uncharacterized protein n=1 Tax=Rotaria magnacalcarata TaxID=392030 RepID=A0A819M8R8_9BILA|nr:unnamed protein product [Rotaria magnacalcarata]CAF2140144.1 unnamed protein product [Rotaria magnacalcarata]CAF2140230.1 unnamed protein product [Rotaria magnacalcarata]CAF3897612.1 unnamed protein product [Rotaria magnacalcarata]CAF3975290.1 unnamed protein product [Rotaria magnacalcarata]
MQQGTSLPVLIENVRSHPKIPYGRSLSNKSTDSSIHQVLLSSSCLNNPVSSRLSFRKLQSEQWERLLCDKKQQEVKIKRNKSNIDPVLNKDIVHSLNEHCVFDGNSEYSSMPASVRTNFDNLYEQMNEITLQLAEERLKHKQTQIKAEETLINQLQDQELHFQERQERLLHDNKIKLKEHEKNFFKLLNDEQTLSLKREEQLRNELEFLKKSFHSYKAAVEKQSDEKLQVKLSEALLAMKNERPKKEEDINKRINEAIFNERKNIHLRHLEEIEKIQKQHQNEIETLKKAVAEATIEQEHLESLTKELASVKLELRETKKHAIGLTTQLNDPKTKHSETIRESKEHCVRFDEKPKKTKKL